MDRFEAKDAAILKRNEGKNEEDKEKSNNDIKVDHFSLTFWPFVLG
jgi:hypothetical protein